MNLKQVFHWLVVLGLGLVPFLPLFVSGSLLFPFISGKNFAFRIIVEIVFCLWLILAVWDRQYRPKQSLIFYAVLSFVSVVALATLFGVDPYQSFWSNFERMDGLINLLHLGAFFTILISVFKTKSSWRNYFYVSLAANTLVLFYGFAQLWGMAQIHQGGVRLDASLGNAAYLATYCLFHIFIATYLFFQQRSLRWIFGISIIANLIILYFTATRGAILGLIGGVLLTSLVLVLRNWKQPKIRKVALSVFLVTLVMIGLFWAFKDSSFVKSSPVLSRFASISITETTTQSRFLVWQMAWQGFKEKPVLGWGPGNFGHVFAKYYNPLMWRQEPWFDRAHNIIFDWLINAGALGLISYLFIFVVAAYYLLKKIWQPNEEEPKVISQNKKDNKLNFDSQEVVGVAALLGLLSAYFFQNLFVFDNLTSYFLFFLILAYIHFVYTTSTPEADKKVVVKKFVDDSASNLVFVAMTLGGIFLILSLYQFNIKPINAGRNIIRALGSYPDPATNLEYYQKVFAAKTFVDREAREQLSNKTLAVLQNEANPEELRRRYLNLTVEEWNKNFATYKEDVRSHFYYGMFLSNIGSYDEALSHILLAKNLSSKKQMIKFELATLYFKLNKADEAMLELKEALELDPNYPEARRMYALGAIIVGENKLAAEIIEPIKNSEDYFLDDRFVFYYDQAGAQGEIGYIIKKRADYYADRVKNNPTDLDSYLKLAQIQISLGQIKGARESLQAIIGSATEEQKTLKTEAENLLKTI